MSSEIYLIDNYANNIDSIMHRASAVSKLIFTFIFLAIIIFSKDPYRIFGYILITIALIIAAKLPVARLLKWSIYPMIFGLMFALSQLFYSPQLALLTLLKAFSTVLLMMFFVATTGFQEIFSFIPSKTLRNTFLLTYRFFFMIVDSISQKIKIMEIRGIKKARFLRKISSISNLIAHGIIEVIEKAERVYSIMRIRGFAGIVSMPKKRRLSRYDLMLAAAFVVVVVVWLK